MEQIKENDMTGSKYASCCSHKMVDDLCKSLGLPEDGSDKVWCVDCGREVLAYGCVWEFDIKSRKFEGPRCGCNNN